jgi:predicted amidohydrolase
MKIAAAAYPISYHDSFNIWKSHVTNWVKNAAQENADILVFPEYGSMELVSIFPKEIQEDLPKQLIELQTIWVEFQEVFLLLAKEFNVIIVAPSFPVFINDKYVNRAIVVSPNGTKAYQDKFFMTPFERFEWGISTSEKVLTVFETEKGNFGIQICYDGEFSFGSRELCKAGSDLILMPSCTETLRGASRVHIGAQARALENQCYTLVSQTIGEALWSPAVDLNYGFVGAYATPDGDFPEDGVYFQSEHNQSGWFFQEFDFSQLQTVREKGSVRNFEDHGLFESKLLTENFQINRIKLD